MLKRIKLSAKDWVSDHKNRILERRGQKKLTMCKKCYTFYYKNSWHFDKPEYLESGAEEIEIPVRFAECPACLEQEVASYEMESEPVWARS